MRCASSSPLGFGSDLVTRSGEVCAFGGLIRDAPRASAILTCVRPVSSVAADRFTETHAFRAEASKSVLCPAIGLRRPQLRQKNSTAEFVELPAQYLPASVSSFLWALKCTGLGGGVPAGYCLPVVGRRSPIAGHSHTFAGPQRERRVSVKRSAATDELALHMVRIAEALERIANQTTERAHLAASRHQVRTETSGRTRKRIASRILCSGADRPTAPWLRTQSNNLAGCLSAAVFVSVLPPEPPPVRRIRSFHGSVPVGIGERWVVSVPRSVMTSCSAQVEQRWIRLHFR